MLNDYSTGFVGRLRARDPQAWFELWETFGPILRAQLTKWGRGRVGVETVQDLSQETMAALSAAIDRHDPSRGARFSTWLLAIAKYTLGDEIDRRMAQKRGGGTKPLSLDQDWDRVGQEADPDGSYQRAVFDAKVEAAIRAVERGLPFLDFAVYRSRVLDGQSGRKVAQALGISEATVSRRLSQVRQKLRLALTEVIGKYSFTEDELSEAARNGLELNPTKSDDALFDDAIAEIYHRIVERRSEGEASRAR